MNTIYDMRTSKLDGEMLPSYFFVAKATKLLENKTRELGSYFGSNGSLNISNCSY